MSGVPVKDVLRGFLEQRDSQLTWDTRWTEKGYMELVGFMDSESPPERGPWGIYRLVFDPEHAYRIVAYHYEERDTQGPGTVRRSSAEIDWADYASGVYYPRSATYHGYKTGVRAGKSQEGMDAAVADTSETTLRLTLREFKPDATIDAKTFTIDGMGISLGTVVQDKLLGTSYNFGASEVTEADLEDMYARTAAEMVTSLQSPAPDDDVEAEKHPPQATAPPSLRASADGQGPDQTVVGTVSRVALVLVPIAGMLCAFMGYRLLKSRRARGA